MLGKIITTLGEFTLSEGGNWHCVLDVYGAQINVWASDIKGQPAPIFVAHLPRIVHDLPASEQQARGYPLRRGDSLHKDQRVIGIFSPQLWKSSSITPDFALQFHYCYFPECPDFDEVTFVDYKDSMIVGWCRLD